MTIMHERHHAARQQSHGRWSEWPCVARCSACSIKPGRKELSEFIDLPVAWTVVYAAPPLCRLVNVPVPCGQQIIPENGIKRVIINKAERKVSVWWKRDPLLLGKVSPLPSHSPLFLSAFILSHLFDLLSVLPLSRRINRGREGGRGEEPGNQNRQEVTSEREFPFARRKMEGKRREKWRQEVSGERYIFFG